MQTFLPYADFAMSARALDRQRLGKQRVETMQIMTALVDGRGWVNHPATKMWRGYERGLLEYQRAVVTEWTSRGYKDTCLGKTVDILSRSSVATELVLPPWLGDEGFHQAHRSNLIRKNPEHYRELFEEGLRDDLPYVWPADDSGDFTQ